MGRLRSLLGSLKREACGDVESFVLEDGSRYFYDPTGGECYLHSLDCLRAQADAEPFPEPPETLKAITRAKDRTAALNKLYGGTFDVFPYDKQGLVARGELVPRSMVVGYELGEPIPNLSD